MPRLPVPGSDDGQWGEILNAFLRVVHNDDGTLKTPSIPVSDKGEPDGVAELDGSGKVPAGQLPDIPDGTITNAKVSSTAAIAQNKIANLSSDLDAKVDVSGDTMSGALIINTNNTSTAPALYLGDATNATVFQSYNGRAFVGYSAVGELILQGGGSKGIAFGVNNPTFGSGIAMRLNTSGLLGVGITPTASNGYLQLPASTSLATGGIAWGTDTNIYRSAADTLTTDDKFVATGGLKITNTSVAGQVWKATDTTGNGSWATNETFTQFNSSTTYTVPVGVTLLEIIAVGGGGGGSGGGASNGIVNQTGGPGGSAGAYTQQIVSVTAGQVLTITIGNGGNGGTGGTAGGGTGSVGTAGGTTTVTSTGVSVTARGGGMGNSSAGNSGATLTGGSWGYPASFGTAPLAGCGGTATATNGTVGGAPIGYSGGGGGAGGGSNATNGGGASMGGSFTPASPGTVGGAPTGTGATGGTGVANTGGGGGGGGGGANGSPGGNGGAGGSGYVIIREIA